MCMSVLFPLPEAPSTATHSPSRMLSDTPCSTGTSTRPSRYVLCTFSALRIAKLGAGAPPLVPFPPGAIFCAAIAVILGTVPRTPSLEPQRPNGVHVRRPNGRHEGAEHTQEDGRPHDDRGLDRLDLVRDFRQVVHA